MPNPENFKEYKFKSNQDQRSREEVIPILTEFEEFDEEFDEEIELNPIIQHNIIELDEAELNRLNTLGDETEV